MTVGCFGNSPEDRYMEGKLNEYLDMQESEQVSDDIEITREEMDLFLSVVGNFPSKYKYFSYRDRLVVDLFEDEKEYDNIMALWDRLYALVQEEDL